MSSWRLVLDLVAHRAQNSVGRLQHGKLTAFSGVAQLRRGVPLVRRGVRDGVPLARRGVRHGAASHPKNNHSYNFISNEKPTGRRTRWACSFFSATIALAVWQYSPSTACGSADGRHQLNRRKLQPKVFMLGAVSWTSERTIHDRRFCKLFSRPPQR